MLYDDQAERFDERAGWAPGAAEAVARELAAIAAPAEGDLWLDVGAGTGAVGLSLLRLPVRYVGFDRSPAMLEVFRAKAEEEGVEPELLVADGNERWPVEDRSVSLVLCVRALHHLDAGHVVAEVRRVLRAPGGWLALGRVRRPPDSVKSVLRRQMRRLLEAEGFPGRSHDARAEAVLAALAEAGGRRVPPRVAARWTVLHRPADSIAAWQGKSGLAGLEVPAPVKARVLEKLREWAAARFGGVEHPLPQEESFEITAIHFPVG